MHTKAAGYSTTFLRPQSYIWDCAAGGSILSDGSTYLHFPYYYRLSICLTSYTIEANSCSLNRLCTQIIYCPKGCFNDLFVWIGEKMNCLFPIYYWKWLVIVATALSNALEAFYWPYVTMFEGGRVWELQAFGNKKHWSCSETKADRVESLPTGLWKRSRCIQHSNTSLLMALKCLHHLWRCSFSVSHWLSNNNPHSHATTSTQRPLSKGNEWIAC